MDPLKYIVAIIIIPCCFCTVEHSQRNVSCQDIKTSNGFKFTYDCPNASEIYGFHNQTLISMAMNGTVHNLTFTLGHVLYMDNDVIITRQCKELQIQCIQPHGDNVKEKRITFNIMENNKQTDGPGNIIDWKVILSVAVIAIVIIVIIGIVLCVKCRIWEYFRQKMKPNENQVKEDTAGDSRIQQTNFSMEASVHGDGGNGLDQEITVDVHNVGPTINGKTAQTQSEDNNFNIERTTRNGNITACDVNSLSGCQDEDRSLRDDPGGVNRGNYIGNQTNDSECIVSDGGPKDYERDEGEKLLLLNPRAEGSDVTGEAVAAVNEYGPDQASGCSDAPETGVESKRPKMRNYSIY